ncbi:MAG: mechanosensitive ion channel family protein [Cyclobacteriaceae bacterium]|nr:mechanosensitive ion channel family protein [Cyclobacteriaceae bacterium]
MSGFDNSWEQVGFAITVLVVAFILGRVVRMLLGRFFRSAAKKLNVDPTRYNFFKNASDFIIYLVAVVVIFRSIPSLRAFGDTLLTGAGILAAIVGFASQSAFSNIVSGIFLVIFRPFSVGDRVRIGQLYMGDVEDITLRHTVIKDFENRRIVIPNTVISNEVIVNSTIIDEKVCMFIEIGVAHEAPIDKAQKIIQEEAMRHPYCIDNRTPEELAKGDAPVMVRVMGFSEVAIQLRGYVWARNPNEGFDLKTDLHKSIKERFDREGIGLAVPLRMITYKNEPPQ